MDTARPVSEKWAATTALPFSVAAAAERAPDIEVPEIHRAKAHGGSSSPIDLRRGEVMIPMSLAVSVLASLLTQAAAAQEVATLNGTPPPQRHVALGGHGFEIGPASEIGKHLRNELIFQRAVLSFLWQLPAASIQASDASDGQKNRYTRKALITTPNSDVAYEVDYFDARSGSPVVIEVPPRLQHVLDELWQRPFCFTNRSRNEHCSAGPTRSSSSPDPGYHAVPLEFHPSLTPLCDKESAVCLDSSRAQGQTKSL